MSTSRKRTWTLTACFASSLDGVIHPVGSGGAYQKLGSEADINHLKNQRDTHDLIIMGAATFRHYPKAHRGHGHQPPLVIITRGQSPWVDIPPDSPAFQESRLSPVTILSQNMPSASQQEAYPTSVIWQQLPQDGAHKIDWEGLATQPPFQPGLRVLFEGGGQLFGQLLLAGWVDELTLTLTPKLLGGTASEACPLVGGAGFTHAQAPRLKLIPEKTRVHPETSEIFAHYAVHYPDDIQARPE